MTAFFTAPDGARLAYSDEAAGQTGGQLGDQTGDQIGGQIGALPLLCLSGLTRTMGDFDYLAPHLPPLPPLRVIRMDYRGRGQSQWTGAATYTIAQEAADAIALLDHLAIPKAAILGTSRGGLIGMFLAATAKPRLIGLCLNDIGPVIDRSGLTRIGDYLGRNPAPKTHAALADAYPRSMPGFAGVPHARWLAEARLHYSQTPDGLRVTYDPALRDAFLAGMNAPAADAWPLFDACAGLPLALIRGANSDLLSPETMAEMQARRPDMITATVPDRAHIPFLDEPESLSAIHAFLKACTPKAHTP